MKNHEVFVLGCQRVVPQLIFEGPEVDILILCLGQVTVKEEKRKASLSPVPLLLMRWQWIL